MGATGTPIVVWCLSLCGPLLPLYISVPVTNCVSLMEAKAFGQGPKGAETDKLNIDSIIARLLEGKNKN